MSLVTPPVSTLRHVRSWRKLPCERLTKGRVLTQTVRRRSLRLDPEFSYDRPPFLRIGLDQRAECLRCLSFARKNVIREIGELRSHRRIGQRLHRRPVELVDRVLRCAP